MLIKALEDKAQKVLEGAMNSMELLTREKDCYREGELSLAVGKKLHPTEKCRFSDISRMDELSRLTNEFLTIKKGSR